MVEAWNPAPDTDSGDDDLGMQAKYSSFLEDEKQQQ